MNRYFSIFQCTGSGTSSDSCLVGPSPDAMKPYCSTGTSHGGSPALGMCGACQKSAGVAGDGNTQGSCTDSQDRCVSTGECQCRDCTNPTSCQDPGSDMQFTCNSGMLCCMATKKCAASC